MRFISWKQLAERRSTSPATEYRRFKEDPRHPKLVQVSPNRVAFIESELDAYDEIIVAEGRVAADTQPRCDKGRFAAAAAE